MNGHRSRYMGMSSAAANIATRMPASLDESATCVEYISYNVSCPIMWAERNLQPLRFYGLVHTSKALIDAYFHSSAKSIN